MATSWLKILYNLTTGEKDDRAKDASAKPKEEQRPSTVNMTGVENIANEKILLQNNGNIPLVQSMLNPEDDMMGLGIQRTAPTGQEQPAPTTPVVAKEPLQPTVSETQPQAIDDNEVSLSQGTNKDLQIKNTQNQLTDEEKAKIEERKQKMLADPNRKTLETQTRAWFGLSEKAWNKLSEQEKEAKATIALKGMIKAYNKTHHNKSSVAHQYEIYARNCATPEEAAFLAKTCKSMAEQDQMIAMRGSYKFQDPELRDAAEKVLATEYTEFHKNNIEEATEEMTTNFSEENIALAAGNSKNIPVEQQERITHKFIQIKSEKVDKAVAQNIGEYGKREDGSYDNAVQLNIFNDMIENATDTGKKATATNTYSLTTENQLKGSEIVINTNNEELINSMATNIYEFDINNIDSILQALQNCGYDSVMETINQARADYEKQQAANEKALEEQKRKNELAKQATTQQPQAESAVRSTSSDKVNLSQKIMKANEKAKEVKQLKGNQLEAAIKDLAENSTLPQLKSLALSGLRKELMNYFMANPSIENMNKLDSLRGELSIADKKRFDEKISSSNNAVLNNFFVNTDEKTKPN